MVDITAVVTHTIFYDDRLIDFKGAGGQIFPFPIDFHRRPYNTLARTKPLTRFVRYKNFACW